MPDIGTGVGAAASIGGAIIGGESAKSAAETQARSVDAASAAQERMFQQNRTDLAPWRASGGRALGRLDELLGLGDGRMSRAEFESRYNQPIGRGWLPSELANINNAYAAYMNQPVQRSPEFGSLLRDFSLQDFQADPSYEFRRNEGTRGIERNAAARGMQLSGATLRALNRYNSDLASQEYGSAFARDAANKERKFNMLSGVAGTGQTATNTTAALGANTASNMASLMTDRGNALAAGQVGAANAWSGGISDAIGMYQQSQLLNRLFPTAGGSSGGGFVNPTALGGANSLYVPRIA